MNTLLEIRNLTLGYGERTLCQGISFDVRAGDCIMLCGSNGSGKTTLLKHLTSKDIDLLPSRLPKVAGFTLAQFIRLCCHAEKEYPQAMIQKAMTELGILSLADRDISTLSDGEFQKGCIASCLIKKSKIILLDEPTAYLDAENKRTVLQTLRRLCDKGEMAVIFSTHDLHEALEVANKVLAFGSDGIFRCSTTDLKSTVSTIFTSRLF